LGKTAEYDQKSLFANFQILMEMGTEICDPSDQNQAYPTFFIFY